MDIEILLILQELRFMLGSAGEWIAINLSDALAALAIVIPFVLFWCFNKRKGQLMLAVFAGSLMINQLLKLACAVYRPWIRDPRVKPGKQSLRTATGYSFPSSQPSWRRRLMAILPLRERGRRSARVSSSCH